MSVGRHRLVGFLFSSHRDDSTSFSFSVDLLKAVSNVFNMGTPGEGAGRKMGLVFEPRSFSLHVLVVVLGSPLQRLCLHLKPLSCLHFVSSGVSEGALSAVPSQTLLAADGAPDPVDFISLTKGWLIRVCELLQADAEKIREGELAAFLSYAISYPRNFLPVIDSYSVGW